MTVRSAKSLRPASAKSPRKIPPAPPPSSAPPPSPSADLLDMDQAIAVLKTTRPTFYRWLRTGKIKAMKVGRQWRFYRHDIERFLHGHEPLIEVTGDAPGLLRILENKLKALDLKVGPLPPEGAIHEIVNRILRLAMASHATDIHIQPPTGGADTSARLRLRLDGVLHDIATFDGRLLSPIVDRFKTMAACELLQKKRPQDGRIMMSIDKEEIDTRVNFLPALMGEMVTLRLLRRETVAFRLAELPFAPRDLTRIQQALTLPWGIVLTTGPTGSGKTTTLYAALQEHNTPGKKVISVEDPVEYSFAGMVQIPVNYKENIGFPYLLRAVLRSDPDVVMVGEIRDHETLQICAQIALTGHLVLSTLHTDDAVTALTRMMDIGLDSFLIIDTVKLVVAQRLIRKLCRHCSTACDPAPDQLATAARLAREGGLVWDDLPKHFRGAKGCKECGFTGYRGRTVAAETLTMSPELAAALRRKAFVPELRSIAIAQGMTTMTADALSRAATGLTTLEEALHVIPQATHHSKKE